MRFRLFSALSALTTMTALLCACGELVDLTDGPIEPSTGAPSSDGGADAYVEPQADAQVDGSTGPADGAIGPVDGSIGPADGSADGGPDAAEPPCVEGDVIVMSASGAATLASTCIHGSLRIDTTDPISLPQLREVSGDVFVDQATGAVSFGALAEVGGRFLVGADAISTLSLPLLRSVAGKFVVESTSLASIDASQLASVGGLDISYTKTLHALSLPALKTVAGKVRFFTVDLTALSLPALERCGELTVEEAALTTLQLPELKTVTGKILVGKALKGSAQLASVALPKLEDVESISLGEHPKLASIDLPRLASVTTSLLVFRAPLLTQLSLPSLTSLGDLNMYELATLATVSAPVLPGSATTIVDITSVPLLTHVDLGAVTNLGRLQIGPADRLTSLSLPSAKAVNSMEIANLPMLTSITFPVLETAPSIGLYSLKSLVSFDVPQLHSLSGLVISHAPKLANLGPLATVPKSLAFLELTNIAVESLAFPNLVEVDDLQLSDDYALTSLSFPSLIRVSRANVEYCPKLPSCSVDAMNAQLASGWIQWDDLAPCTP